MTARRRPPKESVSKEPVAKRPVSKEPVFNESGAIEVEKVTRGFTVALERLDSKINVVVERVLDTPTKRELEEFAARTEARIEMLSDVLRVTRTEFGARFDGVDNRLDGVDKRLDGVDKRLDGVDKRLDGVQQELRGVRQDVARQAQASELRALEQRVTVVERHLGL